MRPRYLLIPAGILLLLVVGPILYGDIDTNTPSQASADRLAALDNPNIQVVIFEGSGHPLEDAEGMGNSYFRQDALERIRDFVYASIPEDE